MIGKLLEATTSIVSIFFRDIFVGKAIGKIDGGNSMLDFLAIAFLVVTFVTLFTGFIFLLVAYTGWSGLLITLTITLFVFMFCWSIARLVNKQ